MDLGAALPRAPIPRLVEGCPSRVSTHSCNGRIYLCRDRLLGCRPLLSWQHLLVFPLASRLPLCYNQKCPLWSDRACVHESFVTWHQAHLSVKTSSSAKYTGWHLGQQIIFIPIRTGPPCANVYPETCLHGSRQCNFKIGWGGNLLK